jgi:hypothetical protein
MARNPLDDYFAAQDAEQAAQRPGVDWPQWRDRYTWTTTEFTREAGPTWRQFTATLHRAQSMIDANSGSLTAPAGFREAEAWGDAPYRFVWIHDDLRIILTYCEGDLDYVEHATADAFHQSKKQASAFYQHH